MSIENNTTWMYTWVFYQTQVFNASNPCLKTIKGQDKWPRRLKTFATNKSGQICN